MEEKYNTPLEKMLKYGFRTKILVLLGTHSGPRGGKGCQLEQDQGGVNISRYVSLLFVA
jgi:hypothetical protein